MRTSTALSLLTASACLLAVPATSQAAETVGSDMTRAPGNVETLYCGDGQGETWPCTLVSDRQPWTVEAPDGHVITRWSAQLEQGAQVRLRLLRRNANGSFTGAGTSDAVTATRDGVQSFKTHIPVPDGDYTIGIDLLAGNVGAIADDEFSMGFTDPPIGDGQTRTVNSGDWELLVSAQAESDYDNDGKGDETEDDCPWNDCGPGGGETPGGGGGGGGAGGDGGGSYTPRTDDTTFVPGPRREEKPASQGPPFTVDQRGLLRPAGEGRRGVFEVFAENTGSGDLDAQFEVRAGRRSLGRREVKELESGDDTTVKFRLSKGQLKQLKRTKRLKLALTATAKHADGTTTPVRQDLTVLAGGASKYDGYYKGPGPIVFVVQGGAIRTVSSEVNAFCPATKRHQSLSIFSIDGFPALVKPDGSFAADGRAGGQALKYNGKFSLRGKSKGYASAYRFELGVGDGGRYFTDGCTGAINWTATKTK